MDETEVSAPTPRLSRPGTRAPQVLLVYAFGGLILLGAGLLLIPACHTSGTIAFVDALFTATSAVCVTGLTTLDTGVDFTIFGQAMILLLIQAGGLGVMTFASLAYRLLGRRISLRASTALQDSMVQEDLGAEFRHLLLRIVRLTLLLELGGAALLYFGFLDGHDTLGAMGQALFHAVSAFCNAGFSTDGRNLQGLHLAAPLLAVVAALVVLGGIGHPVLMEIGAFLKRKPGKGSGPARFSLHTRLVLVTTVALLVLGTAALFVFGIGPEGESVTERAGAAAFQSVSARTAGFNTVDIGALPTASLLFLCILMFIGGAPGSCAGGIKTTTFAVWGANQISWLRGREQPTLLGRAIPEEITRRAGVLVGLSAAWNVLGVLLLSAFEPGVALRDLLFEQVSAFGTVGLDTGVTPVLSVPGKLWIILTMFVGRLGPLTLVLVVFTRRMPGIRHPEGRVMIG